MYYKYSGEYWTFYYKSKGNGYAYEISINHKRNLTGLDTNSVIPEDSVEEITGSEFNEALNLVKSKIKEIEGEMK